MFHSNVVGAAWDPTAHAYPERPPFHPPEVYPELQGTSGVDRSNRIYPLVRACLREMGLDATRYGSAHWNPLGTLVLPGDTVVIKPNLVKDFHPLGEQAYVSSVTHASVIRPILDYAAKALNGHGRIVLADTPLDHADFVRIVDLTGLRLLVEYCQRTCGVPVDVLDLREKRIFIDAAARRTEVDLSGDPLGYATIDLGADSALSEFDSRPQNYYTLADDKVNHFDPMCTALGQTNRHHNAGHHEYKVAKTILSADVIIYVPKLKTHKKAGVTLSLKNSIGIVGGKVYMPHHRPGRPPEGDAYPAAPRRLFLWKRALYLALMRHPRWGRIIHNLLRRAKGLVLSARATAPAGEKGDPIEWGDWSGNDTIWRSIVDLNRILLYADSSGAMRDRPQRRFLSIIDGIIGQEGEGPMSGCPKPCGLILSGTNPVAVDLVAVRAMGFDWKKIPLMAKSGLPSKYPLGTEPSGKVELRVAGGHALPSLDFQPPRGWRNIRLPSEPSPAGDQEMFLGAAASP